MANQKLKKVVDQISKLAYEIYGELGSGFDEKVYQKAMEGREMGSTLFLINFRKSIYPGGRAPQ